MYVAPPPADGTAIKSSGVESPGIESPGNAPTDIRPLRNARAIAIDTAVVLFSSATAAAVRVAGVPAVARAVHAAAGAGFAECWIDVAGGWRPNSAIWAEVLRLAGGMRVKLGDAIDGTGVVMLITGEALLGTAVIRAARDGVGAPAAGLALARADDVASRVRHIDQRPQAVVLDGLARATKRIVVGTAKPSDGIVSRHLNRPVSQAITRILLRNDWIRPIHATAGTACLAVAMFTALLLVPGQAGLLTGAILFHLASVFDGVDGEMARATFRTSDRGALIDSLTDAATNLAFVAGLIVNLWRSGHHQPAFIGGAGLAMLAIGLTLIGRRSRASGGPFSFDAVKHRVRAGGSRLGMWLTWLTMRDLFALASVVMVMAGWTVPALTVFSVIMAGWLVVVIATGSRHSA